MRKLASIRKVNKIEPIKDADRIELAHIDGWQVIINKGSVKENDLAVYFEVDSLLPCKEPFLFLEPRGRKQNDDGSEGYRLRTMKMKGVLSQGLLLPINSFPNSLDDDDDYEIGEDVTDQLGVKLYEPPIPANLRGEVKGNFPYFLVKSDQERI